MKNLLSGIFFLLFLLPTSLLSSEPKTNNQKVKIDIVSDVVCPWCAIGYKRLSNAIDELHVRDRVEIVWHPYELNPDMPKEGQNADEYQRNKFGIDEKKVMEKRKKVTQTGEESGFKFDYFAEMQKVNTLNAHILLAYAKKHNKQTELKVRLQEAYFGERKNISNRDVLYNELKAVGLNADEAITKLDNEDDIKHVRDEEKYWKDKREVFAIPTMFFNDDIEEIGARKQEEYKALLKELLDL